MSAAIILGAFIIVLLFYKWISRLSNKISSIDQKKKLLNIWDIPGPLILPFLGTKWIFFWKYKISKLHEAYFELNKIYGSIMLEVTSGGTPIVHLFEKEDIDKVLKYTSKYPYRPPTEIVTYYRKTRPDRYASIGIINEQGEKWYNLRSKLTHHISSPRTLNTYIPILSSIFSDFIQLLKKHRNPSNNCVPNFHELSNLMGLESICSFILGRRMGFLSEDIKQFSHLKELVDAIKSLFISQRDSYFGLGLWKYFPTETYNNFRKSEETIYTIISNIVDQSLEEDKLQCDTEDMRSVFINILLTENLDIREKKSAIIDFIAAGIETTANTLIFMIYYISKNKIATKKILQEFCNCSGSDNFLIEQNLKKASYTKACIKEVYRIKPTAFCLARVLEEDMILSKYHVKSGTVVLCQNMIACNNEKYFENALEFIPERWLNNNSDTNSSLSLVCPFGTGKRICPGKRFVEIELGLLIAKLVLEFDISFKDELETEFEFLLAPKIPINIYLKDRVD